MVTKLTKEQLFDATLDGAWELKQNPNGILKYMSQEELDVLCEKIDQAILEIASMGNTRAEISFHFEDGLCPLTAVAAKHNIEVIVPYPRMVIAELYEKGLPFSNKMRIKDGVTNEFKTLLNLYVRNYFHPLIAEIEPFNPINIMGRTRSGITLIWADRNEEESMEELLKDESSYRAYKQGVAIEDILA